MVFAATSARNSHKTNRKKYVYMSYKQISRSTPTEPAQAERGACRSLYMQISACAEKFSFSFSSLFKQMRLKASHGSVALLMGVGRTKPVYRCRHHPRRRGRGILVSIWSWLVELSRARYKCISLLHNHVGGDWRAKSSSQTVLSRC